MSETVDGVLSTYTYDANGNTDTKTTDGTQVANYLYDSEDRMITANVSDGGITTATFYAYDVNGIRQSETTVSGVLKAP